MSKELIKRWMDALNDAVCSMGGIAALGYDAEFWILWLSALAAEFLDPLTSMQLDELAAPIAGFLGRSEARRN